MRVLFDHQIVDAQRRGGISRYFYQLTSALGTGGWAQARLPGICTDNEYFGSLPAAPGARKGRLRARLAEQIGRAGWARKIAGSTWRRANTRLNRRASVEELRKQDFDLFHPTYYSPYFLDLLAAKPFVLTIYDMIHEIRPQDFKPEDRTREHKALLAGAAAGIIAISASTRRDIVKYLDVDPRKIEVIHLANSLPVEGERVAVPESYVLYVGCRGRYKNFQRFLQAFARVAAERPALHLVCVNPRGFNRAETELIRGLGMERRCANLSANDRQLAFLYRHAALFVYPSLYEGFGMPVLEAFAAGCPAAVSHTSCFPEIAGDAAVYFDPSEVSSIADAMSGVLTGAVSRDRLRQRGHERLRGFSWAATAERTAAFYRKCLGQG
jgi:glycosyltransferase involved in cell wall biosynthesis